MGGDENLKTTTTGICMVPYRLRAFEVELWQEGILGKENSMVRGTAVWMCKRVSVKVVG